MSTATPPPHLLRAQAAWLAPARARLLRQAAIARRRRVLDLGTGSGAVTGELARRAGGSVTAVDLDLAALRIQGEPSGNESDLDKERGPRVARVAADGQRLPFADQSFDLVFCQCVLMWVGDGPGGQDHRTGGVNALVHEVFRVLEPGAVLIALEPDYGGLIEHPPAIATRDLWFAGLARAGADPRVGRRLPALLESAGFAVRVDLLPHVMPPAADRFELLGGLPLTPDERRRLEDAAAADARLAADAERTTGPKWGRIAHLPFFLVTATRP